MISPYAYPGTFRKLPIYEPLPEPSASIQPEQIAELISDYYQVPMSTLQSKSRIRKTVRARHMAWYFMGIYCKLTTLVKAGAIFGRFDHTTVLHGKQTIKNLIDTHDSAKFEAQHLDAIIKANTQ